MDKNEVFKNLNSIDVNDKTDKKGNLTYLSWAWAWAEVKKNYPDATYDIERFGENKQPYLLDQNLGYMVFTKVTIEDLVHEMWLPVMNYRNQAIKVGEATMTDINKTIMRCLTKNLAMHGLGLYIYAGEDLPEADTNGQQSTQSNNQEYITQQQRQDLQQNAIRLHGNDNAIAAITGMLNHFKLAKTSEIKAADYEKANQFISDWVAR